MTDFIVTHPSNLCSKVESEFQFRDTSSLHELSFEEFVHHVVAAIKHKIAYATKKLNCCSHDDELAIEIVHLINEVEELQHHFEFAFAVMNASSDDEIPALKKRFSLVGKYYDRLTSRDQIQPVPAQEGFSLMYEFLFKELHKVVRKCFNSHGEPKHTKENFARIKILKKRFYLSNIQFALVILFPKDDIFTQPKSSPLWQDLNQAAIFKEFLNKEEVQKSNKLFHFILHTCHNVLKRQPSLPDGNGSFTLKAIANLLQDALHYGVCQDKAQLQTLLDQVNPDPKTAFNVWKLPNHPHVLKIMGLRFPSIGHDELIYVPRKYPAITTEVILQEYAENSQQKFALLDPSLIVSSKIVGQNAQELQELFVEGEGKIPVRILAPEFLNLNPKGKGVVKKVISKTVDVLTNIVSDSVQPKTNETAIVIHIHGGGFVALSSGSHKIYLNRFVNNMKLIHFSIDYRLSPETQYPGPLDDVWQAYLWIVNHAKTTLGIKYDKIILAGDSAGGNLAMATVLRLIRAGLPVPDGIFLLYPCLYVDALSYSPSYFRSLADSVLPVSLLQLVAKSYVAEGYRNQDDPFISPVVACDDLMKKVPPVVMVTAEADPLNDENWRLFAKLRKLGKEVKLVQHRHLPHAFLSNQDLQSYDLYVKDMCDLILELINNENSKKF